MMQEVKEIVNKFEELIKRSILPSTSFMLFLLIFDIIFNDNNIVKYLDKSHNSITIALFILAFIGLTNLLSVLQQAIYDNRLKKDFTGSFFFKNENSNLEKLRGEINTKLNTNKNDYMLYKHIGKDMDTTSYVNQAKSFGIMFISLIIISLIWSYFYFYKTTEVSLTLQIPIVVIIISIEYFIGRELVKSRYRSRAIKLYTNFLRENPTPEKPDS